MNVKKYGGIWRSTPKATAQAELDGRTHYVDENTLRFFKARILNCWDAKDGNLLVIIESLPIGHWNWKRRYRFVVLDVAGNIIKRNDEGCSSSKLAIKLAYEFLGELTDGQVKSITESAIEREIKRLEKSKEELFNEQA